VLGVLFCPEITFAEWQSDGVPVAALPGHQDFGVAVPDGEGGAFVAWLDGRSFNNIYVQRINEVGVSQWMLNGIPPTAVPPSSPTEPRMVTDGQGGVIVAWAARLASTNKVHVQRMDAAGNRLWAENGVVVCPAGGLQKDYQLAPDGSGGALIFWRDERNEVKGDIYGQRVNPAGAIVWDSAGVPVAVAPNEQMRPAVTTCGASGAIVAWEDYRTAPGQGRIYAQLLDSTGVAQWTAGGVYVASPGVQSSPTIVEDGANGVVLAWEDFRASPNHVIYSQRLNSAGAALWDSGGVALGVPATATFDPRAVSDAAGGALVAWTGPVGIHAQHVDASGALAFGPSGMRLTNAPGYEGTARITSDGAGGAIVAWRDSRHGSGNTDIYAQRVSASGVLKWEAEGRAVCTASGGQVRPTIASTRVGSAIVAWSDYRNDVDDDIYAGCLDVTGNVSVGLLAREMGRIGPPRPNPTRASATLDFEILTPQRVSIEVFDVGGRIVRRIARSRVYEVGPQSVTWDGTNEGGAPVPAGIYDIRVTGPGLVAARRIAVIR